MLARSVLVTGSSRGIGLELIKQLAEQAEIVIASCRDPNTSLKLKEIAEEHENVHIVALDVTKHGTFAEVVDKVSSIVGPGGLNVLINNAGILHRGTEGDLICTEMMAETYFINTISPLVLTKAFLPLLKAGASAALDDKYSIKSAAVVNMSSLLGSIKENTWGSAGGHTYSYRCSKAALNMVSKSLSIDLKPANIMVMAIHPGWVKTDMGGDEAPLTPEESVGNMIAAMHQLTADKMDQFFNYDGKPTPW